MFNIAHLTANYAKSIGAWRALRIVNLVLSFLPNKASALKHPVARMGLLKALRIATMAMILNLMDAVRIASFNALLIAIFVLEVSVSNAKKILLRRT